MFLRMALNAIDGLLAREHDLVTPLGGMLNELTDPLADAALLLPLALVPGITPALVVAVVVLAQATELVGVAAVQVGASRRYDGPFGKSDRAMVFGVIGGLLGLGVTVGPGFDLALGVAALLTLVTVVRRMRSAVAELEAA
jgi:CDP-diacylglycerol--glycerol-3-phosphate 3-phosphatidyltransferase